MKRVLLKARKGRFRIQGLAQRVGEDILLAVWGGTRPHIGAVGIAVPRPSLKDPPEWSATSSNYTFLGHKEDALVKEAAEKIASRLRRNTVVTAGMHWDALSPAEIRSVESLMREITEKVLEKFPVLKQEKPRNKSATPK